MKHFNTFIKISFSIAAGFCAVALLADGSAASDPAKASAAAPQVTAGSKTASIPRSKDGIIRIRAGATKPFTDKAGNVWLPDDGFLDGETAERPETMEVENTDLPMIYRTEHYGMSEFSYPVPNGKYIVRLHFAETYEGIDGPGKRVFSFEIADRHFEDFDIVAKAGGRNKAYIENVPVQVSDGQLHITFTTIQNFPEINAIEIVPEKA